MKIRNKLTYYFIFIVGSLLFIFSIAIYLLSANFLSDEYEQKFKEKVILTSALIIKDGIVDTTFLETINKQLLNSILKEKIILIKNSGQIIYNSFDGQPPFNKTFIDNVVKNGEVFQTFDDVVWYGLRVNSKAKDLILVAESKKDYLTDLNQLKFILFIVLIISLVIIFWSGRYFAGKSLAPISRVVNEVDTISATNLHNRVSVGNGRDEIANLAKTFNLLLERLEAAFQLQRNFVSNASHEMRTPLSSITAQLEVTLLNKRTAEEYELVLNSVLEDIRDMNQLSEALFDLTLASRDVSLMKFGNIRIDELLLQARMELLKRKNEYKINIHFGQLTDDETQLTVYGKEHLLKSTFINLMDNACKFSGDKTVDVYLDVKPEKLKITFSDKGIGMPAEFLENIYTPLLRADNAKGIPGHGLGLALSKKIIELHHGVIIVTSEVHKGTSVTIELSSLSTLITF